MKVTTRRLAVTAPLDEGFRPMVDELRAHNEAARKGNGATLAIAWERDGGCIARYDLALPSEAESEPVFRMAERVVKTVHWAAGGWKLLLAGPDWLCRRIGAAYADGGARAFDADLMRRVYERSMEVERRGLEDMPEAKDAALTAGGHLDGCRIGFDLGASDYKVSAVNAGKVVFSEELHWTPGIQSDPDYHFNKLNEGLKLAASHLPRVDAIGGSTAGLVVANRIMVASLFRAVPDARFEDARNIFLRIRKAWQVPVEVANDGDVTALAGAMSLGVSAILGVAMGSSEAGGYIDRGGRLTGRVTELAFAPVDFNPASAADEWSKDYGVGAMYFSQQAVNKLAPAAGFSFDAGIPLPERLKLVQERMNAGDERARRIFETIGVYLGYTVPWYREFYDFDSLMILGRVTSGAGGDAIIEKAHEVLREAFPELKNRVKVFMPDEKARRVGQAVAAASLPG
ncbi:MAG: ROK family protein [Lentisphaerae bacterium]|nr:ROK family protein [Lentisphaerota bacterium]